MKFKEILNEENLFEMANLSKRRHKYLPANLYISYKSASHNARIKIQKDYNDNIHSNNTFSMTVPKKEIVGDTGELKSEDIEYFKRFIDKNKDILLEYWNNGINMDTLDVIESLMFNV